MAAISPVTIEAKYYRKDGDRIVCELCPKSCVLSDGQSGSCGARRVESGKLIANTYGRISCIASDPIEKKPLYNFHPRSKIFSIGSIGCNMSCRHCQNYALSQSFSGKKRTTYKSPEEIVSMCRKDGTDLFAFTYNESGIWYEYIMDIVSYAPDMTYVMVTNGLLNEAPLKDLCSVVDAFNVDIKGFNEDFYTNICGAHLDDVLRSLKIIYESGAHLELTYLVIPEYNDDFDEIAELSEWIRDNLSCDVPLHFTRFHPDNEMLDVPWTSIDTLVKAREIALGAGLNYVYIGNVMTEEGSDTICPGCGSTAIERTGYLVEINGLDDNRCSNCGKVLSIIR